MMNAKLPFSVLASSILVLLITALSAGAVSVTTAFDDNLPDQVLLYETDFSSSAGWDLGSSGYMLSGQLGIFTDPPEGAWRGVYARFANESIVGVPVELEVAEETTTVVYFSERFGGTGEQNQTTFRLQAVGDGAMPNLGVRIGSAEAEPMLGISESVNILGEGDFLVGLPDIALSSQTFLHYRLVLHVVSATETLTVRFDQYDHGSSSWNEVGSVEIPDYRDPSRLGSSQLDRVSVLFRSAGEAVGDLAITQTAPPGPPLFATWREKHFTEAELADESISGPYADPDGDGLANLVEYALDGDPRTPDLDIAPRPGIFSGDEGDFLTLGFVPATPLPSDLQYIVETSGDLITWAEEAELFGFLFDSFEAGDGTGGTYETGSLDNKTGGFGWVPGSSWLMNGAGIGFNVNPNHYVSINRNLSNTTSSTRGARREYADPLISNYEIRICVELADLAGIDLLNPEGAPSTGGGGNITDDDYFAISPRSTAGGLGSTFHWYVEAVGGFWYAMPGSGSSYGTPLQVAPLIEGETYDLTIAFSGENTWSLKVYLQDADETYESGWLPYINPNNNTDENLARWVHFRVQNRPPEVNFDIRLHHVFIPDPSDSADAPEGLVRFRDTVSSEAEGRRFMRLRVELDEQGL